MVISSYYELSSLEDMILKSRMQEVRNELKEQEWSFGKILQEKNLVVKYKCYTNMNSVGYLFNASNEQYKLLIYLIQNQEQGGLLWELVKEQLCESISVNIFNNVDKLVSVNFNSFADISLTYQLLNHFITYLTYLADQSESDLQLQAD